MATAARIASGWRFGAVGVGGVGLAKVKAALYAALVYGLTALGSDHPGRALGPLDGVSGEERNLCRTEAF